MRDDIAQLKRDVKALARQNDRQWLRLAEQDSGPSVETHWGVVGSGGISALSGISGSTLTPGSGTVQEYNSDGTIKSGITETWYNWMNVAIPQHTPVLGNRESDGQIWVKVAPCGTLATS